MQLKDLNIPEKQKEFLNIIKTYADKYENAKTDLKKSFQRKKRNKDYLCKEQFGL